MKVDPDSVTRVNLSRPQTTWWTRLRHAGRGAAAVGALATATLLTGCYVVPIQPPGSYPPPAQGSVLAPAPVTFAARLYPANDLAAAYGMVSAVVTTT